MNIGSRISVFRKVKGYTVNKLANLAGISQSYLRELELGNNTNPGLEVLECICNALDISIVELLDDKSEVKFKDDLLFSKIYQLSDEQRKSLLEFLNTVI